MRASRRKFLKLGSLFVPATFGIIRARAVESLRDPAFLGRLHPGSAAGLLANLQGYWKMDDAANGTRVDSTANSNNLTDTHANVGSVAGALNNCASRGPGGGGSGILQHASTANLSAGAGVSFSASVWAKCTSGSFASPVMGKGNNVSVATVEWFIRVNGSAHYTIVAWDTAGNGTTIDVGANSNTTFFHLVITFDNSTKKLSGYMNGVLGGTVGGGSATLLNSVNATTIPFAFFDYPGNEGFTFGGSIDEAAYWHNRALAQSDVTKLFNSATPLPFSSWT